MAEHTLGPGAMEPETLESHSMNYPYIAISLFEAPLNQVVREALSGLPGYRADETSIPPIPVQRNSSTEPQGTLWTPRAAPGRCALMGHMDDGWYTLSNWLAEQMKVPILRLQATAELSPQYVCSFEYWSDGFSSRSVRALNDQPWTFRQSGKPLKQEDLAQYKAKRIRDRVTPQYLASLATGLGWPVSEADFWQSDGPAFVLRSKDFETAV